MHFSLLVNFEKQEIRVDSELRKIRIQRRESLKEIKFVEFDGFSLGVLDDNICSVCWRLMSHLVSVHYSSFLHSDFINHQVFISIPVILYFHYYGFHVYFTSKFLTLIPTWSDPIRSSSSNSNSSFEHRYDPLSSHIGITRNSENHTRQLAKLSRITALTDGQRQQIIDRLAATDVYVPHTKFPIYKFR